MKEKITPLIQDTIEDIEFRMGASQIDVELEQSDYVRSLKQARRLYLQRAENATESIAVLFKSKKDVQIYDLTDLNIQRVHSIYRHSIGAMYSADTQVDPFTMMFQNHTMGLMSNNTSYGSIATVYMQNMHVNLLQTMMANAVQFDFNRERSELTIHKAMRRDENLILHCEVKRSLESLLLDDDVQPWLVSYATSLCKQALGAAYSKFQTLAGPNGGISLGGDAMRQEGKEEQTLLEEQLIRLTTSTKGMPFTTG